MRSLFDMGLSLLRKHLTSHADIERHTLDGLLALIDAERGGEAVDRALLKSLLRMYNNLGIYVERFQVGSLNLLP